MTLVDEAARYMELRHRGQTRNNSETPYSEHPLLVADILQFVTNDEDIIIAGLLHDVLEDTDATYAELYDKFGYKVAELVKEVTKADDGSFPHLRSREAMLIKLADMIANMSESGDQEYVRKKLEWFTKSQMR